MKIFVLMLALAAGTPAAAQNIFTMPGAPVVIGSGYQFESAALADTRQVNIMLPPGYEDEQQRTTRYPVLYLLDGGAPGQDFFHIAGLVHQASLWGTIQPVIVVGIESKDRRREFTDPSANPAEQKDFPTHGESELFRRFLVNELRPAIDVAYRTNGTDAVIGESLAAYFVVDTALRHGDDFDRYVAISPSLWWNGEALSKRAAALLAEPEQAHRTLWLSIADEGGTMQSAMDRIVAALKSQTGQSQAGGGVSWTYAPMPQESHSTVYHPAATQAIRALFAPPPEAPKQP